MKPYPFQSECLNEIEWFNGRALCALDMGLGKTPLSFFYLLRHPTLRPAVVVCPAAVKYQWQDTIQENTSLSVTVLSGKRAQKIYHPPDVIVINYDILTDWVEELKRIRPRIVIIDECQMVSNHTTKRTKAVHQLCKGIKFILALSGTPLQNRPIELWSVLFLLCPKLFRSRFRFAQRYCSPKLTPWGWQYRGATHSLELNKLLLESCMVRRRTEDVLSDLPPMIRSVVPLPIRDRMEYQRANSDFLNWLSALDSDAAKRAARAETVTKVGYLLRLCAQLKLAGVVEWVNSFFSDRDGKLILFAIHKEMISNLRKMCGVTSVVIDGDTPPAERKRIVQQFQEDSQTRLLIGNIQAAGTGIDGLQKVCDTVAFIEIPWRPGVLTQAERRIWRIGSTSTAWVYYLISHNTIEEILCKIVQQKQEGISLVLDGGKVDGDLDVFDQLMKSMIKHPLSGGRLG